MVKELFHLAKKSGLKNFQILQLSMEEINLDTRNQLLEKYETSATETYLISAFYQKKKVQIYTEELTSNLIDLLKQQAKYLDLEMSPPNLSLEDIEDTTEYQLEDPTPILRELLQLDNRKEKCPQLLEVNSTYCENILTRTLFTETKTLTDKRKEKYLSFEILVKEGNLSATAYDYCININNQPIDSTKLYETTLQNALDKLYYQELEDNIYPVILSSKVMGQILNKFISLFTADSIQKGISLLTGKQNQEVFSKKITIIEDPANPNLLGKRRFDNAGTKTYLKTIVEKGIFKTILYDDKTASIDKKESTGNDYGEISVRNLYIKPGTASLETLIESIEEGVLIDNVTGLHAGINTTNGNISLQSEGYYIKNGQKQYASKLFVLSTNIMDILNNVKDISNHIDFCLSTTASPDILVENIKISK